MRYMSNLQFVVADPGDRLNGRTDARTRRSRSHSAGNVVSPPSRVLVHRLSPPLFSLVSPSSMSALL